VSQPTPEQLAALLAKQQAAQIAIAKKEKKN
jgi:hypothetical protein